MTEPSAFFWTRHFRNMTAGSMRAVAIGEGGERHFSSFGVSGDTLQIPFQASFGGWISESGNPSPPMLALSATANLVQKFGLEQCRLVLPPGYFLCGKFESQSAAFRDLAEHFELDTNHHIYLPDYRLEASLSRGNRKRVRAFFEKGGEVVKVGLDFAHEAFLLLEANRARRGVTISMSESRFLRGLSEYPEVFSLYLARMQGRVLAAAYVVEIHPEVSYVLFWGDTLEGRRISAVAPLASVMVDQFASSGKKVLDLGVSSSKGRLDEGLARFKVNLGSRSSDRYVIRVPRENLLTHIDSTLGIEIE